VLADGTITLTEHLSPQLRVLLDEVGQLAARAHWPSYAVGGCVRDWLLGRPVNDVDLVIEGDGIIIAQQFAQAHRTQLTTHVQFKTATVLVPLASFARRKRSSKQLTETLRLDFATCRKEIYAKPAAYPKVSAGTLQDDLFRRDVTINAMAMRLSPTPFGRLIDLFRGYEDLRARLIRVLHPQSFRDDPSRILRAIRFAERLHCTIEPQTATWMRRALHDNLLARLNRGRLRKELLAILHEPEPLRCLRTLSEWLLSAQGPA